MRDSRCGGVSPAGDVGAARIRLAQIAEGKSRRPLEVGDPEKIVQHEVPNLLAGFRWGERRIVKNRLLNDAKNRNLTGSEPGAIEEAYRASGLVELLLQPEGIGIGIVPVGLLPPAVQFKAASKRRLHKVKNGAIGGGQFDWLEVDGFACRCQGSAPNGWRLPAESPSRAQSGSRAESSQSLTWR